MLSSWHSAGWYDAKAGLKVTLLTGFECVTTALGSKGWYSSAFGTDV